LAFGAGGIVNWWYDYLTLFGATNQLMAALTLMIVTVILLRKKANQSGIP
jgi:carbon starvation protein